MNGFFSLIAVILGMSCLGRQEVCVENKEVCVENN